MKPSISGDARVKDHKKTMLERIQTNICQVECVLVGIYLFQAIWALNHLDFSGYNKIYSVVAQF